MKQLNGLWQKLDVDDPFDAEYVADGVKFRKCIERKRLYKFLAGLNLELDQILV